MWDRGKVRDRFSGMGRFKGGLSVRDVITDVTTYRYLKKYMYYVKTCIYTINALYQMINLNVST